MILKENILNKKELKHFESDDTYMVLYVVNSIYKFLPSL